MEIVAGVRSDFRSRRRSMLRKRTSINVKCCYVAIVSLPELKSLDRG
ncbi:hypothetical protein [Microcoleus sp. AT3-D2]